MPARSTYRVQLHSAFGFAEAAAIVDYLAELGVTHLYCSPYLQAAPGSTHGYDVVDPTRLNSELGGAAGHAALVGALRAVGMGQVLDIVPNHMAADQANRWWWDVLENGPSSPYARFFDIDWEATDRKTAYKVLVPVLGDDYGRVVDAGEVGLARQDGELIAYYYDHHLPVSPRTLDDLLAAAARRAGSPELATLGEAFAGLPTARRSDPAAITERHDHKLALAADLDRMCRSDPRVAAAVDAEIAAVAGDPDRLDALLRRQNYRLAHWRTASEELDYRRFFNIETLVGLRMEDPAVFEATHRLVLELVRDGSVAGLRIDHVDGLRDPRGYLDELAVRSRGVYTVVEKILGAGEPLDGSWPVAGTSGYDFLIRVNNLFVATANEAAMTGAYTAFTAETATYADVIHTAKLQIMRQELSAEVHRVTGIVADLTDGDPRYRRHRDHTRRGLREAIRELAAHFPVYRTYVTVVRRGDVRDRGPVDEAVRAARSCRPDLDPELFGLLGQLALGEHDGGPEMEFAARFQQLTAPVTAKGVEDTAFYRYNRLTSLNEVGGDPGLFGRSPADFHRDTAAVAARWPDAMLTLSTHDTKRSADVRARLNGLSEIPGEWSSAVGRWAEINDGHRRAGWPDPNTEYLYYQTLVGAWPLDVERAVAYMAKATREAKVHTSWVDPAAEFDEAVEAFVRASLADGRFVADLERFLAATDLVARGRRTSLAQTALLLTCPGVPDLYQGSEVWDLSLVDPDNRRPVDYPGRRALLREVAGGPPPGLDRADTGSADAGRPKLALIQRLLAHRAAHPEAYAAGCYEPLRLAGPRADDAIGFRRDHLVVVAPRLGAGGWGATTVDLPAGPWADAVTGAGVEGGRRALAELWAAFPVAVLARAAA